MVAESYLSRELKHLTAAEFEEIDSFIRSFYPLLDFGPETIPALEKLIRNDKKNESGIPNFTLLKGIGNTIFDQKVDAELVRAAISFILNPSE